MFAEPNAEPFEVLDAPRNERISTFNTGIEINTVNCASGKRQSRIFIGYAPHRINHNAIQSRSTVCMLYLVSVADVLAD